MEGIGTLVRVVGRVSPTVDIRLPAKELEPLLLSPHASVYYIVRA